MTEKLTRKDFFAVAATGVAAVGAATLIPSTKAIAEEVEKEVAAQQEQVESVNDITPLSDLDIAGVEHGVEALGDTVWAEAAPLATESVKSHSGLHMMNAPCHFAFTGWNTTYDIPTETGFALNSSHFYVSAPRIEFSTSAATGQLADWVIDSGKSGVWTYQKWVGGKYECWGKQNVNTVCKTAWSAGFYRTTIKNGINFPITFKEQPVVEMNYLSTNEKGRFLNAYEWPSSTSKTPSWYLAGPDNLNGATTIGAIHYHVIGRWK